MKKIKLVDLLKDCYVNDSDMYDFKNIHPKQLISEEIPVPIWKVYYSYCTARGNVKEAEKYIIKDESAWDCIESEFNWYIKNQNEKHPERKISNVEILDAFFIGCVYLSLE